MIYLVPDLNPEQLRLIFQFPHTRDVKSVAVMGTINKFEGTIPLAQRLPNGPWEGMLTIARGSEHWFCYMVNGNDKQVDPHLPVKQTSAGTYSYFTAILEALKPSAEGATSKETLEARADYHMLTGLVPAALSQPKKRISLAAKMHALAQKAALDATARFDLLQQAALLDPFNTHIRLSLGQFEMEQGMVDEAIAHFKNILELRPDEPRVHLLLGEAFIAAGQWDAARESLNKMPAEGKLGRRAIYDLIEIDLRKAGDEDWKKILEALTKLEPKPGEEGLFCEKCLKLLSEWDAPEAAEAILTVIYAHFKGSHHPAIVALKQVAAYEVPKSLAQAKEIPYLLVLPGVTNPKVGHMLVTTLCAQRLARAFPVEGTEDRVARLGEWRRAVERVGAEWRELRGAYLQQLSDWAIKAYKGKEFDLAATLWGEADRVAPHTPVIQQNLAIVTTRLGEDSSQAHYWQSLTRTWTAYSDLLPEAEGYGKHLIQKHQVFVEGAEQKLMSLQTPQELLELGEIWIKEALPLLVLRQLAFHNPLFRCGVISDDYVGKDERGELIEEGFTSALAMLRVSQDWVGLGDTSALAQKRLLRLDAAYQATQDAQHSFRHYEEEKAAFKLHREMMLKQYLMLLFRVMLPCAEKLDLNDAKSRQRYATLARGMLTFPHRVLKPGVRKAVEQLEEDTDMQQLVMNYAVGPWFKRAQEHLQNKQPDRAAPLLEEALQIAPDFTIAMFYLAQCRIEQKHWDEIEPLLKEARQKCKPEDELLEHIDNLLENLPMIKIQEEFKNAQRAMEAEEWPVAARNLEIADQRSPNQVPVLFYLAVSYFRNEQWDKAEQTAKRTLPLCKSEDEATAKEQLETLLKQLPMARVAKSMEKARQYMDKEQWRDALKVLDQILAGSPDVLVALFYKSVCHMRLEEWDKAERAASDAQARATKDDKEIKEQLDLIQKQIPMARKASALKPVTDALEGEKWSAGVSAADRFLENYPNDPVALFYQAVCYLRSGQIAVAKATAEQAQAYAQGKEYSDLRNQLETLIKASSQPAWTAEMNRAVQEMNSENWLEAWSHLNNVLKQDRSNATAHYYQALCWFKFTMDPLQKQHKKIQPDEVGTYTSAMETVLDSLDKAEQNSSWSDKDLRKGINNLREAASNILKQLRGY